MTVNGIELKEGQVWTTTSFGNVTLSKEGVSSEYPWYCSSDECNFSITEDGKYWEDDNKPILLELIKEETTVNKFNPQPGDKIICNNGEEFICCTLETLVSKGFGIYFKSEPDSVIFGMKEGYSEWMYWHNEGYPNDFEWNIREVVPQSSEVTADKKEEVEEGPLYSLQEIKEAWDVSGWATSTSSWSTFQKNLMKISSPEYQEYLRLKAIYE